uniref:Uncharacterized protein n=1 Tax=Leersia perrieri TaxID=77586 RepID=A0A0D9WFV6_9ORYZ
MIACVVPCGVAADFAGTGTPVVRLSFGRRRSYALPYSGFGAAHGFCLDGREPGTGQIRCPGRMFRDKARAIDGLKRYPGSRDDAKLT